MNYVLWFNPTYNMNSAIKKSPDQLPIVYKCYHCRIKIMTQNSTPTSCKYVNYSASCVPYATTCTVLMFVVLLCPFIFTPPPLRQTEKYSWQRWESTLYDIKWNASPIFCQLSYVVKSVFQLSRCGYNTQSNATNIIFTRVHNTKTHKFHENLYCNLYF